MRRKNKKIKIKIKFSLLAISLILVVFFVFLWTNPKTRAAVEGWGIGIWNDTLGYDASNNEQLSGIPTIGWLTTDSQISGCGGALSKKYSINIGEENPIGKWRPISGSAWFGIGSKPDSDGTCQNSPSDLPSLGWLNFSAGSPYPCPGECHSARWHPKDESIPGREGYLDGWANVTSMGSNGWVRLRGENDGELYAVTSSNDGTLSGYAWNSGTEDVIDGNSGLGWIGVEGLKLSDCKLGCATKPPVCRGSTLPVSSCDSSYCTGDTPLFCALDSGKLSWTCSNASCGDISCAADIIDAQIGACGELNGKSICDSSNPPTADRLCSDAATYNNDLKETGIMATWTCGNSCPGGEVATCSASASCGWVETAP